MISHRPILETLCQDFHCYNTHNNPFNSCVRFFLFIDYLDGVAQLDFLLQHYYFLNDTHQIELRRSWHCIAAVTAKGKLYYKIEYFTSLDARLTTGSKTSTCNSSSVQYDSSGG